VEKELLFQPRIPDNVKLKQMSGKYCHGSATGGSWQVGGRQMQKSMREEFLVSFNHGW
jgi:phage pi2 protein 07